MLQIRGNFTQKSMRINEIGSPNLLLLVPNGIDYKSRENFASTFFLPLSYKLSRRRRKRITQREVASGRFLSFPTNSERHLRAR
jgi:hypothetical protein